MSVQLRILIAVMALAAALTAQQVVYIDDANPATGTSNSFPWGQANGFTTLHVYYASQLSAGGVCAGSVLTDVAVAPSSGTSGTYMAPQARLSIGHLANSPPVAGLWEANIANPAVVWDLPFGPYTFPWTQDIWTSIPGFASAGFVWDGVTDIAIFYTSSPGTTGTFSAHRTATNLRHALAVFQATNQAPQSNGNFAMKVRLTFTGGASTHQVNQPGASLDVNGVQGNNCAPAQVVFSAGTLNTLNLSSTNAGQFWDLVLTTPEPSVPGFYVTAGGQVVNVNLLAPSLTFLNPGFSFVSASLPMVLPQFQVTTQMVVGDPALPDGFALSQVTEINSVGCQNPQNFDSLPLGIGNYPIGWSDGGGASQWTVDAFGTSSTGTGPTAATSLPNYIYCETSGNTNTTFKINTCLFDTAGIPSPTLNFALSRIGATIGTLNVWQDDGSGTFPILIFTYTGADPGQSQGGVEWSMESLPIDTTTGIPLFQFDYLSGSSFTGDIAIDDVQVL